MGLNLPNYDVALFIEHNSHKTDYKSFSEEVKDLNLDADDFISEEDMHKCIDDDNAWMVHWYPDTPVGFFRVYGSSLEAILDFIKGDRAEK